MTALLTELRGIGLAMGTRYAPTSFTNQETREDHVSQRHVGYTTDPAKATVTRCGGQLPAWEVTVTVIDP